MTRQVLEDGSRLELDRIASTHRPSLASWLTHAGCILDHGLRRCSKSEELRKRLDIEDVTDVVRKSRLGWFGHLERKDDGDWASACRNMAVPGNAGKRRPRKRWRDVLKMT